MVILFSHSKMNHLASETPHVLTNMMQCPIPPGITSIHT